MKKLNTVFFVAVLFAAAFVATSCTYNSRGMSDSNARLQLEKSDITISETVSASAKETVILGIDWSRLFKREVGEVRGRGAVLALPIIGVTPGSRVEGYATYNLLKANSDYDAVLYPQFEGKTKGLPFLFQKTNVTVKAKMVRVNP